MCASESCSLRPSVFVFYNFLFVFLIFFLKDGYDLGVLMLFRREKVKKMLSEFFDIISISSTSGVITVIVSLG